MDADPTPALLIHDGAAGNRRQVLALAQALGVDGRERVLATRWPWSWAAPRALPGVASAFGPGFADALAAPPPLAIGCGRQAALATRVLRARGSRVVQILAPRLPTRHWDVVVAPHHDRLAGPNVVSLHGSLNPVGPDWIADARAAAPARRDAPGPRIAFFVGAPTAASDWDRQALESAIDVLAAVRRREGGTLWVATSRRTPRSMARRLAARLAGIATVWTGDADGPNPFDGWLAWADRLVVTPDSANLVSEAAATPTPMWIAFPGLAGGRVRVLVDHALASGRARPLGPDLSPWPVRPWDETRVAAAAVAARLGLQAPGPSVDQAEATAAQAASS